MMANKCEGNGQLAKARDQKKAAFAAFGVKTVYLNLGRLNCGGTPMRVLIIHC
jgi:hypothetical protein